MHDFRDDVPRSAQQHFRSLARSGRSSQLRQQADARALPPSQPRRELVVGKRCAGRGGRRRVSGLHGDTEPGAFGDGDSALCDLGRHGQGRVGLQGDLGLADLLAAADGEDGLRAGAGRRAGRRAGRGLGDADADGVEPEPVAYERGGPDRDRDDLQHRQDAEGVDRALRAHGGRAGTGCGGRPGAGEAGARRRGPPRRAADWARAAVRSGVGRGCGVRGRPDTGKAGRGATHGAGPGQPAAGGAPVRHRVDARRPSDRQSGSGCRLEIRERSGFGRGRGPVGPVGSRARPAGRFVLLAHHGNQDARNRLPVGTRRRYPLRRPRGQPVARPGRTPGGRTCSGSGCAPTPMRLRSRSPGEARRCSRSRRRASPRTRRSRSR